MNVILCEHRFEQPILNGIKSNTIRRPRKDDKPRARVGETISLRVWSGLPYRSKQREFAQAEVDFIFPVRIGKTGAVHRLDQAKGLLSKNSVARSEGFGCAEDMRAWFESHHGLPFEGTLIHWKNLRPSINQ